jgi:hypothetical protein
MPKFVIAAVAAALLGGCAEMMQTGYQRLDADYATGGQAVGDCVARMGFQFEQACFRDSSLDPSQVRHGPDPILQSLAPRSVPASGAPTQGAVCFQQNGALVCPSAAPNAGVCFTQPGGVVVCP